MIACFFRILFILGFHVQNVAQTGHVYIIKSARNQNKKGILVKNIRNAIHHEMDAFEIPQN